MTLNQILYFAKTAEYMHMASAARELAIAQPSLSMSLSKLEEELGVALFEKKGRGISVTPEGQCFLQHARRILADVDAAEQEIARRKAQAESLLTVAYINPLSESFLPKLFHAFRETLPEDSVQMRSVEMDTNEIIHALQNNTVDLALCSRIEGHDELTQIPILRQPLMLIVPKGHRLEQAYRSTGGPVPCAQLEEEPFIIYFTRSPMHRRIMQYFQQQGFEPNLSHYAYNEAAIASLVANEMGIAIVARVEGMPWERIVEIPLEGLTDSRNIYLTYRTNRQLFRPARQMLSFIRQKYELE